MPTALAAPWLIADVGATQTRIGVVDATNMRPSRLRVYVNSGYPGLEPLLEAYLGELTDCRPVSALLAVAAPVCGDEVQMVNLAWSFSRDGLTRDLGLERLELMNDFAAIAWSLPVLKPTERLAVGSPVRRPPRATLGVLGPGTGLGVAALTPCGDHWTALASEGGHVTLAAMDDQEAAIIADLRSQFGHCSAERVLSGPGLIALYRCLRRRPGEKHAQPLSDPTPPEVAARALTGEDACAIQTLDLFFSFLGTVASNLALSLGARGGIYLAGGILPRLTGALMASRFRSRFVEKGRYRDYLEAIPTYLITHPYPALRGLCAAILEHRGM